MAICLLSQTDNCMPFWPVYSMPACLQVAHPFEWLLEACLPLHLVPGWPYSPLHAVVASVQHASIPTSDSSSGYWRPVCRCTWCQAGLVPDRRYQVDYVDCNSCMLNRQLHAVVTSVKYAQHPYKWLMAMSGWWRPDCCCIARLAVIASSMIKQLPGLQAVQHKPSTGRKLPLRQRERLRISCLRRLLLLLLIVSGPKEGYLGSTRR